MPGDTHQEKHHGANGPYIQDGPMRQCISCLALLWSPRIFPWLTRLSASKKLFLSPWEEWSRLSGSAAYCPGSGLSTKRVPSAQSVPVLTMQRGELEKIPQPRGPEAIGWGGDEGFGFGDRMDALKC